MSFVLLAAGTYHILFGIWTNAWPHHFFDLSEVDRPNHPVLWRGLGLLSLVLGVGLVFAARAPIRHWAIILTAFVKCNLVLALSLPTLLGSGLPGPVGALVFLDDLLWWIPLAMILWACAQAHAGRPPSRDQPYSPAEAADAYRLSSGETLAEAAEGRPVVLVFLRHFGCTFTRRLLGELKQLRVQADSHGARLVLVHMLEEGRESRYLSAKDQVARIADPRCELYRAFGLGKGGFLELFGPRVWLHGFVALFKGCGVGGLAGDGLQMPGAFLFRDGEILAAQPARSAADPPDLPGLFEGLNDPRDAERIPA